MTPLRALALSALLGLALPLASPVAHAQQEVCKPYTQGQLEADLDRVDDLLDEMDIQGAKAQLSDTRKQFRCLETIVDRTLLARFARRMAMIFFFDQDEEAMRRWGLLARYADPDLPWSDEFPPEHPFREMVTTADDPVLGGPDDQRLEPPKRGGVFMNGQLLLEPRAPAEVPVLMQVADKKGEVIAGYWQDGARFPDEILAEGTQPPDPPRWWDGPGDAAVADADSDAGPSGRTGGGPRTLPTGRLAATGGLAVASGTLALLAAVNHAQLGNAQSTDDLVKTQTVTNVFGLGAGVMALGAVGVGVTVFVDDSATGIGIRGRF